MTVRSVRLTDRQFEALEQLAESLKLVGQRGARFQPLIRWLADTAMTAPDELITALLADATRQPAGEGVADG